MGEKLEGGLCNSAKYFAIKKNKWKRGKNSSKESRSQECKVQGREGGWTNLHHTHLPPDAKKKKETPQSILYYSIHRDEGVQEAEGEGGGGGKEI